MSSSPSSVIARVISDDVTVVAVALLMGANGVVVEDGRDDGEGDTGRRKDDGRALYVPSE